MNQKAVMSLFYIFFCCIVKTLSADCVEREIVWFCRTFIWNMWRLNMSHLEICWSTERNCWILILLHGGSKTCLFWKWKKKCIVKLLSLPFFPSTKLETNSSYLSFDSSSGEMSRYCWRELERLSKETLCSQSE